MPEPSTTRLGLYKPLNDGSELVNVQTDLNQNWDKVDLAAGLQIVTSSTRPSSPYPGKAIAESDTSYRSYFSNGTSPASASWVQIPNSSSTFNADLDLTSGRQVNIGASSSGASLAVVNAATTTDAISLRVTGDTQSRFLVDTDGTLNWGPGGSSAADAVLARSGTAALALTGSLTASGALAASNFPAGAWSTYTPAWTTSTGSNTPSLGNATVTASYTKIGRTVIVSFSITFGSTTNFGGGGTSDNWRFSLPVEAEHTPECAGMAEINDASSIGAVAVCRVNLVTTGTFQLQNSSGRADAVAMTSPNWGIIDSVSPWTWAQNDAIRGTFIYEAAS
ncbi:hypothetical protein SMD44_00913 [Streptomyces alboflavus]|uniref:Uncharacterized protein n=1 Tax=Streptomyces alboflavus TaxID=67267 RepID=A0A1Z1W521_9ACTN|nr:hypothetical protein [Streptomyces alboflavus]ARX81515.1 hypothetical protein SMD44_00913 [Streptomyces alboflavus]